MPIQLNEEHGGKLLILHISGKLLKEDYGRFVSEFERLVRQYGKLQVLFDTCPASTTGMLAPRGRISSLT